MILIVDYHPGWPHGFGSTIIDISLALANSADEAAYVPALEPAGYPLRIREPEFRDWLRVGN